MTTPRRNSYDLHPHADAGSPPVAQHPDRACNGVDPQIFFPERETNGGTVSYQTALKVCRRCDYQQECADWAIQTRQAWGVWGGTTPVDRRKIIEEGS